jgi:cytochrome P450
MYVPGGTSIGYGGFSILRNKKIWGEDADMFRPERWLESEGIKDLEQTWEVIFNAGRYQCLGKNIALMELNKVFVEVSPSLCDSCAVNYCLLMLSGPTAAPAFRIQRG